MEFKFSPLEEFSWVRKYEDGAETLIGVYHVGAVYNCSKEARHDALREMCKEWKEKGMISTTTLPDGVSMRSVTIRKEVPK